MAVTIEFINVPEKGRAKSSDFSKNFGDKLDLQSKDIKNGWSELAKHNYDALIKAAEKINRG